MNNYLQIIVISLLFFILPFFSIAQTTFSSQAEMESALERAQKLSTVYEGDKAMLITDSLLTQLKAINQYKTSFGFKVRLVHSLGLIRSSADVATFEFLWELRDDSQAAEEWEIYAQACRGIAYVTELTGQSETAFEHLWKAQATIEKFDLDSVYASVCIRHSSVHRWFGDLDSARYFVQEALKFAPIYGQKSEEGAGYFLTGTYSDNESEKLANFQKAANIFQEIEEIESYIAMKSNMIKIFLKNNNAKEALLHIDSANFYQNHKLNQALRDENRGFHLKAIAFEQLGKLDSAILYFKNARIEQLARFENQQQELLIEVDRKYNLEKKSEELATQKREVKEAKARSWLLAGLALLLTILVGGLIYYYLKLRKVNKISQQQAEQLQALDQAKTRFFANVSHELRTPLSLILGPISSLLEDNQLTEKQTKLLQLANRGGKNLRSLVNEILDLSKMEANQMELRLETVSLADFFNYYVSQFESLAVHQNINYQHQIWIDKNKQGKIDPEKCRQIIYNLLSNAFKFTPTNGKIKVLIQLENEVLSMQVADSGKGIAPEDLPQVFDRYFQTNVKNAPAAGGTGIGLAICQEYVQLFGGNIEVKSQLGQGATFYLQFPIEITTEKVNEKLEFEKIGMDSFTEEILLVTNPAKKGNKPTILVVEDSRELQTYMKLILEKDHHVLLADNGKNALELLNQKEQRPEIDLIISDLMMPKMDGYQLVEKVRNTSIIQQIPFIMLTARAGKNDRLQALRIGVDDYLTKPFDEEELKVRIQNLLGNRTVREETLMTESAIAEKEISSEIISADQQFLQELNEFLEKNISNSSLNVLMIASEFAMSESTLLRQLKRLTGLSTQKYITEIRLNQAIEMLESGRFQSVNRVGVECGYTDVRTFSRSFKKRFGKLPSEVLR